MPPLDPLSLLHLARELAAQGGDVRLRTAVGGAYYALFLLARERLNAYPKTVGEKNSVHALVLRGLRKRRKWTTANQLYDLKELRIIADYQLIPGDPTRGDGARNWSRAHDLVDLILPELQAL